MPRTHPAPSATLTTADLIAPCGINCRLCRAYRRERNPCPGCRAAGRFKERVRSHCGVCCEKLAAGDCRYCFECGDFPCKLLLHLDKRYRTRYATSPLDNLARIHADGIRRFVQSENEKWACPGCGELLCMHDPICPSCGYVWHP